MPGMCSDRDPTVRAVRDALAIGASWLVHRVHGPFLSMWKFTADAEPTWAVLPSWAVVDSAAMLPLQADAERRSDFPLANRPRTLVPA
jgi:hypothetical protein